VTGVQTCALPISLNGFSAGPDFPAEGTILSTLTNVTYPVEEGGAEGSYYPPEGGLTTFPSQKCTVNLVADGAGGDYLDWENVTNVQFFENGVNIAYNVRQEDSSLYFEINGQNYVNGYRIVSLVHNGYGGASESGVATYNTTDVFYTGDVQVYHNLDGTDFHVGNTTREYRHDGYGGYTYSDGMPTYYYNGYSLGSFTVGVNTEIGGNMYPIGNSYYEVQSNGLGQAVYANAYTSYFSYGTYVATYDGYNYYSDETGGTYTEPVPSYPENGTETGNTSSGTNYIDINGTQYENGSYSGTEYHDGIGGTYWSYSYSYQSQGYVFTSSWNGTDEYGNDLGYTYYYSDGNGGYTT
jgi:hypothetical protein